MNKKFYAILTSALSACMLCGCGSSAVGETKTAKVWAHTETVDVVYDCFSEWGNPGEVMPVLGYWNAPRESVYNGQYYGALKNDEYFASVAEAGINLLEQHNDDHSQFPEETELTLEYCDKYNVGYFVTDYDLFSSAGALVTSKPVLKEAMQKYMQHKSFAGFYLKDEPLLGTEESLLLSCNTFYDVASELDLNAHLYLNLNPYWASTFKKSTENYEKHIDGIYAENQIAHVAYDIYPLKEKEKGGFDYEWFFTNLSLIRDGAIRTNKTWIPFVSVSDEGNYVVPTEGELMYQVNTYLAFGAKGMYYFPINTPISMWDYMKDDGTVAMYDLFGNKTKVWYYVREANKQIQAIDAYLMKATNHGVIFNYTEKKMECLSRGEIIQENTFRELTKVSGDNCMVGCFDYHGKTCLYVVNADMSAPASVNLNFDARYGYEVVQRGQSANVTGKQIKLSLAAGEGALILLK